jgi:hypothetical protein
MEPLTLYAACLELNFGGKVNVTFGLSGKTYPCDVIHNAVSPGVYRIRYRLESGWYDDYVGPLTNITFSEGE